jgi:predicted permease
MSNFILIIFCLALGYFVKKKNLAPDGAHKAINLWIINAALPATALKFIPAIKWNLDLIFPLSVPLLVWIFSIVFVSLLNLKFKFDAKTKAALILAAGLGNTSFIGFPLTQGFYGDDGLKIAALCDQISFIVLSSFGIITAIKASDRDGGKFSIAGLITKLAKFPPLIAFVFALIAPIFMDISPMNPLFDKLSSTLVPLALFSVGLQLNIGDWKNEKKLLSLGLFYKVLLAPAIVLLIGYLFNIGGLEMKVGVFEASMPPMITAAIISAEYDINPELSNLLVGVGIILCAISAPLWYLILNII